MVYWKVTIQAGLAELSFAFSPCGTLMRSAGAFFIDPGPLGRAVMKKSGASQTGAKVVPHTSVGGKPGAKIAAPPSGGKRKGGTKVGPKSGMSHGK